MYGDFASTIDDSKLLAAGVGRDVKICFPHAHRPFGVFVRAGAGGDERCGQKSANQDSAHADILAGGELGAQLAAS